MRRFLYGFVMVLTQLPLAGSAAELHVIGTASSGGTTVIRATASGAARVTAMTKVYRGGCNTGYARVHTTTRSCRGSCTGASSHVASSHVASSHVASSHFKRNHVVGVRVASDAGVAQSESHAELLVSPRHSGARVIAIADSQVASN